MLRHSHVGISVSRHRRGARASINTSASASRVPDYCVPLSHRRTSTPSCTSRSSCTCHRVAYRCLVCVNEYWHRKRGIYAQVRQDIHLTGGFGQDRALDAQLLGMGHVLFRRRHMSHASATRRFLGARGSTLAASSSADDMRGSSKSGGGRSRFGSNSYIRTDA